MSRSLLLVGGIIGCKDQKHICRVSYTQIVGCEGGRATRMAPNDATIEKIRDKDKTSRFKQGSIRSRQV